MTVKIIGAGIAGLLAARMLRHHDPVVIEASASLPHNHSAVLRFRSSVVGDALGIEFKKVSVIKSAHQWRGPVQDALAYSHKNGGTSRSDRSIPSTAEKVERYIAPPDLIARMAEGVRIEYGTPYDFSDESYHDDGKVISTIPMPALMRRLAYQRREEFDFNFRHGVNLLARIKDCDAYVSVYVPSPHHPFSRLSICGDELIAECPNIGMPGHPAVERQLYHDLLPKLEEVIGVRQERITDLRVVWQSYAKIDPVDEGDRRRFIYWASVERNRAFSLGRFATWRPGLLADDLVKDIRLIDGWIRSSSSAYDMEKHERRKS